MRNHKILLPALTAAAALMILTGCSTTANESTKPSETTSAAETSGSESASSANETSADESTSSVLQEVTLTAHTYDGTDENYIFTYDEEGRITSMARYLNSDTAPEDASLDETLYVDYSGDSPDVHFNDELFRNRSEDDADYPTVYEVTTFDDGTLKYVYAGCDAAMKFEFNEDGLPIYCSVTQDMGDYAIEYSQDSDGRYVFASAVDEYPGHFDEDSAADSDATSVHSEHPSTFDGEVVYR